MASGRKRPRPQEESQADCPFKIEHPLKNDKEKKTKRARTSKGKGSEESLPKHPLQVSPFSPSGKFKDASHTLDRHYLVTPNQKWTEMTRYNSFVLNGVKYYSEGFIFVANGSTIERQKNPNEAPEPRTKSEDDWVARILEIRARDEHHVYARVYWMYWPDELPSSTLDGKRLVHGRQSYHGANELIASNHMDVINVVSVTAGATVNQWDEKNEEEVQSALYWRQAIDVRTMELSSAEPRCKCRRPENPDKTLVGCTNEDCKQWLHDDCLIHEALLATFQGLGTDRPRKADLIKEEEMRDVSEGSKRPSPSESAPANQQATDVKAEDGEHKTIKTYDVEGSKASKDLVDIKIESSVREPKKRGRQRRSDFGEAPMPKPYLGLFEAVTRNDLSPPVIEIKDLRREITEGEKEWTQPIRCLCCKKVIH